MSSLSSVQEARASEAVVRRIADREGADPLELPPLYEVIDPEALDALVENGGRNESALRVEFTYEGYEVTVTDDVVRVDGDSSASQASM